MANAAFRARVKPVASRALPVSLQSKAPLRILIASHSHPQLSKGGAEIAAFELFSELNRQPEYDAWFLGCLSGRTAQKMGTTLSQPFSEREYLYSCGAFDWFKFANRDPKFPGEFRALLRRLQPDIVHFHHYLNFGVEAFLHVREVLPECRIIVTLHEYLAICHHYGQMITRQHHTLCYRAAPTRCATCFNEITPSDFFLRKLYIQRFFELVDRFVAPSRFLAERYVAWGIAEERVSVLENIVTPTRSSVAVSRRREPHDLLRVGVFGQISLLKGINVVFDTAELLLERKVDRIVFEIHGDYRGQPPEFQQNFLERLAKAGRNVRFLGAYEQPRVDHLMQALEVILVPSIWWENSPLVIQEALRNQRPVICSDIGGMAEKVQDGVDGFHFPVGNCVALASLLTRLLEYPGMLSDVAKTIRAQDTQKEVKDGYVQLYSTLVGS